MADAAIRSVDVLRRGAAVAASDHVAVEMPLEVRLNGYPFAVVMRTPGYDRDLALGFLFTEGIVRRADDVQRVDLDEAAAVANVVFVRGRDEVVAAALDRRRQVTASSSCGVCGRHSLTALRVDAPRCAVTWTISDAIVASLPDTLRSSQSAFAQTGGLHAAGLFALDGRLEAVAEDVGRHNAVDKLLGRMLDAGSLPLASSVLFVSGRTSFEIVQKAWLGGVPFVAAVSAPSSLAIDLARDAGITLLGFVRDGRFNVYANGERIRP